MNGFLGMGATFRADLNLIIQISMGAALLVGMGLARRKKFREHKYCQMAVILLNLVLIATIMLPSFHRQVSPQLIQGFGNSYYAIATVHAGLGTIAELLGVYIVLVAGTKVLPERLRFNRFKPWMRTELALWWIVILLGVGTYFVWYVVIPNQSEAAVESSTDPDRFSITIRNFEFEPKQLSIETGATVEWVDSGGRHTVESDDGSFKSGTLTAGGRFEHVFDQPGTYRYYCSLHGDKGGKEMSGVITVIPRSR